MNSEMELERTKCAAASTHDDGIVVMVELLQKISLKMNKGVLVVVVVGVVVVLAESNLDE